MNATFSPTFLNRISDYPEAIQSILKTELDPDAVLEHVGILHGPESVGAVRMDKILSRPMLVDTLLGRLLQSRKFQQRVRALPRLLLTGDKAVVTGLLDDFILPLGDLARPYVYKLNEILVTEEAGEVGHVLPEDVELLTALRAFHDRAQDYPGTAREIVLREILAAGGHDGTPFLPCLLEALGLPDGARFRGAMALPASLTVPAGTAYVRAVLARLGPLQLQADDIETLGFFQRDMADAGGFVRLHPARPVTAVLTGAQSEASREAWEALRQAGVLQEVVARSTFLKRDADQRAGLALYMPARSPVSPVLLACLACAGPGDLRLSLKSRRSSSLSTDWSDRIVGYPETGDTAVIGQLEAGAAARALPETRIEILLAAGPEENEAAPVEVAPEDCFAIVVRLGAGTPAHYTNIDHCVTVQGFAALAETFADAPPVLRQKPVVVLGPHSPADPNHLIALVQSFWAHGGRYPVTPLMLHYDGETSRFQIRIEERQGLSHIAIAAMSALPLETALGLDPAQIGHAATANLLLLPEAMIVCDPHGFAHDPQVLAVLERSLNEVPLGASSHEAAFLAGVVDYDFLSRQSVVHHWPIAALIKGTVQRNKRLETLLRKFRTNPGADLANTVMQARRAAGDVPHLTAAFDDFALRLALHPQIPLRMEDERLHDFLKLVRQLPSADTIAARLLVCSADICRANRNHIIPLFELLASCLPPSVVHTALAVIGSDREQPKRAHYRIGECMRRYGSPEGMMLHLAQLSRALPDLLEEPDFLRFFQRLLHSDQLPNLQALVGAAVIRGIAGTLDFKDDFLRLLEAGDRDALLEIMSDPERTRNADFLKWMDSLRSRSNELCEMNLPITDAAIPQLSSVYGTRLMASIFSDTESLRELDESGLLEDGTDLSLIALNILRKNDPLNTMLASRFAGSGVPPVEIAGETAAAVFAHAAGALAGQVQPRDGGPLVSVVISAWNADIALLNLSIESVLAQTHRNVEIFVVDDGSEPASSAAIREAVARHAAVRYMRVDVNSGPYIGRNLAIAAARGDFIAIQDADDWSHPCRFAAQLALFEAEPTTQLVTCPHIRIDKYGRIQMEAQFTILGDGPMTSMFRRSAFDRVGVFAEVRSRGDVEMRERMRAYFGNHALREMDLPMMLCFADSQTLSQRTRSDKHEFLQLFRSSISQRGSLRNLRRSGTRLGPEHAIAVPLPLRPTSQGV